jgi:hypothetical protein
MDMLLVARGGAGPLALDAGPFPGLPRCDVPTLGSFVALVVGAGARIALNRSATAAGRGEGFAGASSCASGRSISISWGRVLVAGCACGCTAVVAVGVRSESTMFATDALVRALGVMEIAERLGRRDGACDVGVCARGRGLVGVGSCSSASGGRGASAGGLLLGEDEGKAKAEGGTGSTEVGVAAGSALRMALYGAGVIPSGVSGLKGELGLRGGDTGGAVEVMEAADSDA